MGRCNKNETNMHPKLFRGATETHGLRRQTSRNAISFLRRQLWRRGRLARRHSWRAPHMSVPGPSVCRAPWRSS